MHLPVLLLDPDESSARSLAAQLQQVGFDVETVVTAAEALELLETRVFSSMVIAADLADASCRQCIGDLRRASPRAWLIVLTDERGANKDDTVRGYGADAILMSPCSVDDLTRRLVAFRLRSRPTF